MQDAILQLRKKGYSTDFTIAELQQIDEADFQKRYVIDETYRFDEWSDPDDQSAIYAISSRDGSRRGLLIDGYGTYSDPMIDNLIEEIEERH